MGSRVGRLAVVVCFTVFGFARCAVEGNLGSPDSGPDNLPKHPDASTSDVTSSDVGTDTSLPEAGDADAGTSGDGGIVDDGCPGYDYAPPDGGVLCDGSACDCSYGNDSGACTLTEALLVHKSPLCYQCMVNSGCIDDAKYGDTNQECGDLSGPVPGGCRVGTSKTEMCIETLDCILATDCVAPIMPDAAPRDSTCYCGGYPPVTCMSLPATDLNGPCKQVIADGLGYLGGDSKNILLNYTDTTRGAGMANQIFQCAISNNCPCY